VIRDGYWNAEVSVFGFATRQCKHVACADVNEQEGSEIMKK
jgi:hypothetical protein